MDMTKTPCCPDAPHIGYLLKHRDIALAMIVQAGIISLEDLNDELEAAKYFDFKWCVLVRGQGKTEWGMGVEREQLDHGCIATAIW